MLRKKSSKGKKPKASSLRNNSSPVKLALAALAIVLGIILLGKTIEWVGSLFQPISKDFLSEKRYSWDKKSRINIALKSSSISVISFDPVSQKLTILNIPDNLYMELPKGYGSWAIGSVFDLGQSETPQIGSELLKQSLAKLLGIPMDGFITIDSNKSTSQIVQDLKSNPVNNILLLRQLKTDLTPVEALALIRAWGTTRNDKIISLDFEHSEITLSKLLPDASRVLGINNIALDTFIREKMSDPKFIQEGLDIAVFNATNHSGLASEAAREITNMGGNVISTTNTQNLLSFSQVISSEEQKQTSKRLSEIFAPQCLNKKCISSDPKIASSRAQINIILGEDFYRALHLR